MAIADAVIPVAGRGTRMSALSRAQPKELLPLADRPVVQHVVDELGEAGVRRALLITARGKEAIEDHLDGGDHEVAIHATRQPAPFGLGDAVLRAAPFVSGPVICALGDTVVRPGGTIEALVRAFGAEPGAVAAVAVQEVPEEAVSRFGIVTGTEPAGDDAFRVGGLVEKPAPGVTESRLAISARYVLGPAVLDALARTPPGRDGELQLTDALHALVAEGATVVAVRVAPGTRRLDVGTPESYCAAFLEVALSHDGMGPALRRRARELLR